MEGKKLVILGGGTAGWLTALFCRKLFPLASITLIENTSVGTVGVGEGTTMAFMTFLRNEVDIDAFDLLKECRGSVKSGISFENWNGDNKKYFHSFGGINSVAFSVPHHEGVNCNQYFLQTLMNEGLDFNEYSYGAKLAYRNELDLHHMTVALHIDTFKVGKCLKSIGEQRNIFCVDGNFSHVQVDENDFINAICLDDGRDLDCDFVFDCSGFAKLLIGKYYKVPWISYKDYLPMKKAIAFPLEPEKDVKPYTQAIAMKYGWMWKIPIQDRIGAGYVFDSDYVEDEEVVDEAQQFLGQTIPNVRSIPFDAGSHEKYWVKNCISVGLASNFIEPLEATSLDTVGWQLRALKDFLNHIFTHNEKSTALYNNNISNQIQWISYFIYLHYLTKRSDTEFWKTFEQRHPPPQKFVEVLSLIYENNLRGRNLSDSYFGVDDYIEIANGLGLFKQSMNMYGYENLPPSVETYKKWVDVTISDPTSVTSCTDFLEGLDDPGYLELPLRHPNGIPTHLGDVCRCLCNTR